jgi:Fe2+ transport system protein FeoA
MATLDELKIGQEGRISRLDLTSSEQQRFLEMGLTIGARVTILKLAPLGDPMEIKIRGYHLSLRRAEAKQILVDPVS